MFLRRKGRVNEFPRTPIFFFQVGVRAEAGGRRPGAAMEGAGRQAGEAPKGMEQG